MADNVSMLCDCRMAARCALILLGLIGSMPLSARAQVSSPGSSWSTSSQQSDPNGTVNPTRTSTTHTEVDGRVIEKTVIEARDMDGRYVPYSEIERQSVRVNDTTVRNIERSYGRTSDGQRTLTQETSEESRSFPDGSRKVIRTTSSLDGSGGVQVVQRAIIDSKQVSPGVRETNSTVFSADGSGGLAASVQIRERERQTDATTVEFTKSTSLSDGAGHWTLSEVREGTVRQQAGVGTTKEERVLRPNGDGKLAIAERSVSKQAIPGPGQQSETTETYSTNVPGQAGDEGLRLVRRESTQQQTTTSGGRNTTRVVEQPNPGDPGAGLHVTQEAIDIVRTGANGVARQQSTLLTTDANGQMNTVWIDMGSSNKPAAVKVDMAPDKKTK